MIRRLPTVLLWIGAVCVVAGASWVRLQASLAGDNAGYDFRTYYSAAARALTDVGTPYAVDGYVYSPLVAVVVATLLHTGAPLLWWNLISVMCGVIALIATWRTFSVELSSWRAPAFVIVGGVLLFWTWPVTLELFYGQSDLLVLAVFSLAVLAARRGRAALFGGLIGLAGLVKTWPIIAIVWVFRRGADVRRTPVVAMFVVLLVGALAFAALLGPSFVSDWYLATRRNSVQPYLSYSAFGVGRDVFAAGTQFEPLLVSSGLRWAVTAVLGLWALTIGVVALRRPHDEPLAFWHLVGCGLLILPVSHWFYLILLVPIVWIHVVRLLSGRVTTGMVGVGLVVAAWWLVAFRTLDQGRSGYLTVVGATFVMLTVSVLRDAWLWRSGAHVGAGAGATDAGDEGVRHARRTTEVGHDAVE